MTALSSGNKISRVRDLIEWGFNSPLYFLIPCISLPAKEVDAKGNVVKYFEKQTDPMFHIWNLMNTNKWKRVSIRFPGGLKVKSHNMINVNWEYVKRNVAKIYMPDWIMVSEGMPIAQIWSGCIEVRKDGQFILEAVVKGPVRMLTHGKVIPEARILSNLDSDRWRYFDTFLVHVIEDVKTFGPVDCDIIYEFSVFSSLKGVKQQHVLFWEYEVIDGYSEHYKGYQGSSCWGDFRAYLPQAGGAGEEIPNNRKDAKATMESA